MSGEAERWQRRIERERAARKEAERLLEEKSLALYNANQQLQTVAGELERQVAQRTAQLEAALLQAQLATRAKAEFLATMSHEIRTPMNGMLGMAEMLHHSDLSEDQRAYVDVIRSSGDALLALINDILDFSKIDAGHLELELRNFDLRSELDAVLALFRPLAEKKGLRLVPQIAGDLVPYVNGDSGRLRQVFSNLLSNAVKFTPTGSITVTLATRVRDDGRVHIQGSVSDTGIGIAPERKDRLFKVFSQGDSSTTREYGGTGLGLAICARLTQAMGGGMAVDSGVGQGSTFRFDLYMDAGTAPLAGPEVPSGRGPSDASGFGHLKVLLAEDNPVNQTVALKLLARLGVDADLATEGEQALRMAQSGLYDLVFMDMHMPVMDGLQSARAIRQLDLARQPYIVALTANAFESDRELCKQAGMDDFLSKPFSTDDLREKMVRFRRP